MTDLTSPKVPLTRQACVQQGIPAFAADARLRRHSARRLRDSRRRATESGDSAVPGLGLHGVRDQNGSDFLHSLADRVVDVSHVGDVGNF